MSGTKVVRALLVGAPAATTLVPAEKIVIGNVKIGTPLPAIGIKQISLVPLGAIDAQAEFALVVSRVQVTVEAKDYASMCALISAVRKACNYQRGAIAGVNVVSVLRDIEGPDPDENDAQIYDQVIDFKVTYHEPN